MFENVLSREYLVLENDFYIAHKNKIVRFTIKSYEERVLPENITEKDEVIICLTGYEEPVIGFFYFKQRPGTILVKLEMIAEIVEMHKFNKLAEILRKGLWYDTYEVKPYENIFDKL